VRAGGEEPKAVPVSLITRLEDFDASTIEQTDGRSWSSIAAACCRWPMQAAWTPSSPRGRQPVLVFAEDGRSAGVAVDEILDVVEERLDLEMGSERPGVIGSAIIKGKATEVLDIAWHMQRAWSGAPQRADRHGPQCGAAG
jgi:two-component system chemotaxis sensor kinase CheA